MSPQTKTYILYGAIALLIGLLLFAFLRNPVDTEADNQREVIRLRDEIIAAERGHRQALELVLSTKDTLIAVYKQQAATSLKAATKNQVFYIENKKNYEAIPANVRGLTDDSLQRAIERYYENR